MARHAKTIQLMEMAKDILAEYYLAAQLPMTVRQTFYQLISCQAIENTTGGYNAVIRILRDARLEGIIPWEHVEDRLRKARHVSMWSGLSAFGETCLQAYRRDVWQDQPHRVECWLEKDALSGIFKDVLDPYGVTLNVGRGYDGWSSIHDAAVRYGDGADVTVLYCGDFDPSGENMFKSLKERLAMLGSYPTFEKVAILSADIEAYDLPPNLTKKGDTRTNAFIAKHGNRTVELDALPAKVLIKRLTRAVESRLDLDALQETQDQEHVDKSRLAEILS